ncbi:hypothetical protein WS7_08238 [Xanthomonas citri pv. malvacearum str. GSPB2388]|nr:hypothetical protein WS7_08238 [Xanthomonas citri pv. malvacearum str. GSPB2388]
MPEIFADMRFKHLRHQPVHGTPNRGDLLQDRSAVCARLQRPLQRVALPAQPAHARQRSLFLVRRMRHDGSSEILGGSIWIVSKKAMPSGLLTVVLLSAITAPRWQMGGCASCALSAHG